MKKTLVAIGATSIMAACHASRSAPRPQPTAAVAVDHPSLGARIRELSSESRVLTTEPGSAGDRISTLLEVPPELCAIVIARAGPSVEDLDLFAYGEDGSVVGTDEGPDSLPGLLVCPPHPKRIWVAARVAAGYGLVAIGAQLVPSNVAQKAAAALGVRITPSKGSRRHTGAPAELETALSEHRREIGGEWQDIRRINVPLDARVPTRVSAAIEAGRCLDAVLVPSHEAGHLELNALDEAGSILGRARAIGRTRAMVVCASEAALVSLEIRPQSGRGTGWLSLSQSRAGSEASIDTEVARFDVYPAGTLDQEEQLLKQRLEADHGHPAPQRVATGQLEVARRSSFPLAVKAGCTRLDVVGARPLRGLQAYLLNETLEIQNQEHGTGQLTLFTCGAKARTLRLDLEARLRSGPFATWASLEPEVPPNLLSAPLAAGRLLANMVSRGVLRKASEIGQVRAVQLSDGRLESVDLTVPFGRCMDVSLALGAGASGAEVRLVASDGAQVSLGRGNHAASARVCALSAESAENTLKTRAELRTLAGATQALVATRMLSPTR